jgi:hypothetical protein
VEAKVNVIIFTVNNKNMKTLSTEVKSWLLVVAVVIIPGIILMWIF